VLVPGDDDLALADALTSLVVDRDRARKLGAAAARSAWTEHSLASCADRYVLLYEQLVAKTER
jgi:hypothetical protein